MWFLKGLWCLVWGALWITYVMVAIVGTFPIWLLLACYDFGHNMDTGKTEWWIENVIFLGRF